MSDTANALILAPHPDDAEIAAYGFYAQNPATSYVVNITAGDAGGYRYKHIVPNIAQHARLKGLLRTGESLYLPRMAGLAEHQTMNLCYFDDTLKRMYVTKNKPVSCTKDGTLDMNHFRALNTSKLIQHTATPCWQNLVDDIAHLIEAIDAQKILTPCPFMDDHEDHYFTTVAAIEALRKLGRRTGVFWFYVNHYAKDELWPYGNMGDAIEPPPMHAHMSHYEDVVRIDVPKSLQAEKHFTLNALSDLSKNIESMAGGTILSYLWRRTRRRLRGRDGHYTRRAVRANELFFSMPVAKVFDNLVYDDVMAQATSALTAHTETV